MHISGERAVLDRNVLRIHLRSSSPCLTANLIDSSGRVAVAAPTLLHEGEYSCALDLAQLAPGQYSIVLKSDGASAGFGRMLADAHDRLAQASPKGSTRQHDKIAESVFVTDGGEIFACLYADLSASTLGLRISRTPDVDGFLEALTSEPIRFSVISPVYNVERYVDEFLASITSQTLDFRSHIELIMVDDGSTDRSATIIKRWRRKFPKNIRYFYKENGGLSSARNFGMPRASHEWITFADPDDFVDGEYFSEVAKAIRRYGEERVAMVSCNVIRHYETTGAKSDDHPLRFRYAAGEKSLRANDLGGFFQLGVNHAILRKSLIDAAGLAFDGRIRPAGEDAPFVANYLLLAGDLRAIFLPGARYFYRKRADRSSLVDSTATHPETFGDQLRHGALALLRKTSAERGNPPPQVQNAVLYEMSWRFRQVVDRPDAVAFLGEQRREQFRHLLDETFALIDARAIVDFDVPTLAFFHKVGLLNLFKDCDPPKQLVEINAFDETKGLARMVCWTRRPAPGLSVAVDGVAMSPAFSKRWRRDFMGEVFCWEHIAWVPVGRAGALSVAVDGQDTSIRVREREVSSTVPISAIRAAFAPVPLDESAMPAHARELRRLARSAKVIEVFRDAWLFMDRDTEADDNAEHLYRWVRQHHPEINAFFLLAGDAPDWQRLADEGFRLLTANAPEHAVALVNAKYVISSHADRYVYDRLPRRYFSDLARYKYVFLQHGVILHDISGWLNWKPIDCFVTSTRNEFDYIVGDGPFVFTRKEVVLTGLPRHDSLPHPSSTNARNDNRPSTIVVMPTWRHGFAGSAIGPSNRRPANPEIASSKYVQRWRAVLNSRRLQTAAERLGFRIVFVPHKNIEQDLDAFAIPPEVEVRALGGAHSIQCTLRELSLFVTDYTSATFDVAYLLKPVIYYQFDRDFAFGGGHLTRKGYFDYDRDGFGPVFTEEEDLIAAIEAFMEGRPPEPIYRRRAERTFPFHDGKCCERVFNAILDLERPNARTTRSLRSSW